MVIGGGFAALESVLALRALSGRDLPVTLVAPDGAFAYRPAATLEAFGDADPLSFDLETIANDLGVRYQRSRLEAVAPQPKWVRLTSGARLDYEALVLAIGARARGAVAGAVTFRDQRDVPRFRSLLQDIDAGRVKRVLFAIPAGSTWPVPLYELALLSAHRVRERGLPTEVMLVSADATPLAVFGPMASEIVAGVLADRGVRFVGASAAKSVLRGGTVQLEDGRRLEADRVIAAPGLRGQRLTGVPANRAGFVPTDMLGRVHGLEDVYAIGDMTAFPIKHGGLATQQADCVAHVIAQGAGFTARSVRAGGVVRVRLVGGEQPLFLRAELDQLGRVSEAALEDGDRDTLAAANKVSGRYLVPYLEKLPPSVGAE
jgi:sulfide:quinone oxidoreductase